MSDTSNVATPITNPFRSLVGLRGIDTTAQLWVNDLPGMTTELVADLAVPSDLFGAEPETDATAAVWESVHRNAYKKMVDEIRLILGENYDFQPVAARSGEVSRAKPFETLNGAFWTGIELTADYAANTLVSLHTATVFVMPQGIPDTGFPGNVRVYDLNSGTLFYSSPVVFHYGVNELPLHLVFRPLLLEPVRLAVLIDQQYVALTELCQSAAEGLQLEGVRSILPPDNLLTERVYMALDVEVTRSLDALLPRYAKDLVSAYSSICGSLLMTEKLTTTNLSVFTLSNPQVAERMETKLCDDFKRALRPVVRLISNELQRKQALTVPVATPDEITYSMGSYV
jgi:hypothetical protein